MRSKTHESSQTRQKHPIHVNLTECTCNHARPGRPCQAKPIKDFFQVTANLHSQSASVVKSRRASGMTWRHFHKNCSCFITRLKRRAQSPTPSPSPAHTHAPAPLPCHQPLHPPVSLVLNTAIKLLTRVTRYYSVTVALATDVGDLTCLGSFVGYGNTCLIMSLYPHLDLLMAVRSRSGNMMWHFAPVVATPVSAGLSDGLPCIIIKT